MATLLLTLGVVALFVAIAVGGHSLVWRRTRAQPQGESEVAGHILGVVGGIYAVVLAFVVVAVWQNFDKAHANEQREASAVADLYHAAEDLPEPIRSEQRSLLVRYVNIMIADEWPAMQNAMHAPKSQETVGQLRKSLAAFAPRTTIDANARSATSRLMDQFSDARRERIADSERGIPAVLWLALIAGASATIGFVYLFSLQQPRTQLAMTGLLALVIGIMFALIVQLNHPYRGPSALDSGDWQRLSATLSHR